MECILFRHGIAVEPDEWEGTEEDRPLTNKGKKHTRQAAQGLAFLGCRPTHVFASPFVRAYDTARIIRTAVCPRLTIQRCVELINGTRPEHLVAFLRTFPSDAVVLCVGHEPLLGEVASLILCGQVLSTFPLKKAGAACLELTDGVKPGQARLRWWLQPGQLRAIGKRASGTQAE